ncbi:hypothetical protein LWI29_000151 [Acer saccharum]|uniref:Putative E3 ubiquitin-protein ligase LIN N-terminal domain-containing protein n=1 Tax=Acer saccharum TaxID=4024 RepID=A0AA39RN31_ACESA|nr:hypothetical protein LWI29_000151 [Acer saccharum]
MLRNNVHSSVLHVLKMYTIDLFFSRIDFVPELWKKLFLPQMSSIVGWYSESRHRLVMEVILDSSDLSFTADFDQFFNESLIFSLRPNQVEKLQNLEQLYRVSLDENTRLFAKHYKDCMNSDSTTSKKSAGFSPILKSKSNAREGKANSRTSTTSQPSQTLEEFAEWDAQEELLEEDEYDVDYEPTDDDKNSENLNLVSPHDMKMTEVKETGAKGQVSRTKNRSPSTIFSHVDSTRSTSSKNSSPKPDVQVLSPRLDFHGRKESPSVLHLLSRRVSTAFLPTSPRMSNS